MRILVLSDSHGYAAAAERAFEAAKPFDSVIFLGDGEYEFKKLTRNAVGIDTYCVRGNNDFDSSIALCAAVNIGGIRFLLCHGHTFGVWAGLDRLAAAAAGNDCEIALFGHTHCRHYSFQNGIHLFNPGSLGLPRDGKPPCYGIITIENGKPDFFHFDNN